MPLLSVIIPTHNPDESRLQKTLAALAAQLVTAAEVEVVVVDNCSSPPVTIAPADFPFPFRVVREAILGLSAARRRGLTTARGEIAVFVDDDNVLACDYLEKACLALQRHPTVGAIGGKSMPAFAGPTEPWQEEFLPLLALRDLGDEEIFCAASRDLREYPIFAPIGAGMALRKAAVLEWTQHARQNLTDRRGLELTSGGDNDLVLTILLGGWGVGYVPSLRLIHLIPSERLEIDYLARLNRGIQKSWMQVLTLHGANPWPTISSASVPLRKFKSWITYRGWRRPAEFIRWQGACGHFEGRAIRSFPNVST